MYLAFILQIARALNWVRDSFQCLSASLRSRRQDDEEDNQVPMVTMWQDVQKVLLSDHQLRENYMRDEEEVEDKERMKTRMAYELVNLINLVL